MQLGPSIWRTGPCYGHWTFRRSNHVLLGLGYFDHVDPDEILPAPRQQIVDRPFCAIPRPTGRPEIAEEERPGVTPCLASYVIEFCPRKTRGVDGLGNVALDATDRLL